MSNEGDGKCPNCGITRPSNQFRPVKLAPGPGGTSNWLRCPACGFRAAKGRFGFPPPGKGAPPGQARPSLPRSNKPAAGPGVANTDTPKAKPRGTATLQEELNRIQARMAQVAAEIDTARGTNDQNYLARLMDLHGKLQSTGFDLRVKLALTEDSPPAK